MSILAFQMPNKVVMEKSDAYQGLFEFKPLERGFGTTIGNALRRVLLSSLEGYAIIGIKMPSVLHEFSAIEGVVQDVTTIILNLKQVRFKPASEDVDTHINISLRDKEVFTAGDIAQFTNSFEIANPDFVICEMEKSVEFDLEIVLQKGRGYTPSEEHQLPEQAINFIAIDSIFTPIKNVKFMVENTRVEQITDFEKLILDVTTDGTIHPETALKEAAKILIQHFMLFSDQTMTFEAVQQEEQVTVDEEILRMRKLLKTSLSDLDLSVRAFNCLKSADIRTLGDLVQLEIADMMKFRNFGKKSLTELEQLVADKNLNFGMDISKYKLDED